MIYWKTIGDTFIAAVANRHLEALHTNHNEETTKQESIAQIRFALEKSDINLPK